MGRSAWHSTGCFPAWGRQRPRSANIRWKTIPGPSNSASSSRISVSIENRHRVSQMLWRSCASSNGSTGFRDDRGEPAADQAAVSLFTIVERSADMALRNPRGRRSNERLMASFRAHPADELLYPGNLVHIHGIWGDHRYVGTSLRSFQMAQGGTKSFPRA